MKIFFLSHRLPYPPDHGAKIRAFNMIKHLSSSHSLTIAAPALAQAEINDSTVLKNYSDEVISEVIYRPVRCFRAAGALFTTQPSSMVYFWSPALHARIKQRIFSSRFDLILVHCAFAAQYVTNCKGPYRILDYVDMDSAKWREYSRHTALPLSFGYQLEERKLRIYERELAKSFDHCTVTTAGEKVEFDRLDAATPCTVIPNGVDTDYFKRRHYRDPGRPVIVFVGRMDYLPNVEGVLRFVRDVFPLIRAKLPAAEFRIVGSSPTARVRALRSIPGVVVTGHVSDVRAHLQDAAVSVAPLVIARGTQNKILESMAMGIPVVATPEAAKGVMAVPGRDIAIADDSGAFANAVLTLLDNSNQRETIADAAHDQIHRAHLWSRSMGILDELLTAADNTQRQYRPLATY